MAISKAKRSVHPSKAARRDDRRASNRHPDRRKPAERRTKNRRSSSRRRDKIAPGSLALVEQKLPCRRFVDFPQVNGKTVERIHFYTATDYHSITIDFQDDTSLNLEIEPSFTINAELQQIAKGDTHTLAEWPLIRSQT